MEMTSPHNDQVITNLMRFLELRIQKRNLLQGDLQQKRMFLHKRMGIFRISIKKLINKIFSEKNFRNMLVKVERENVSLKIENATLKALNEQQKEKVYKTYVIYFYKNLYSENIHVYCFLTL